MCTVYRLCCMANRMNDVHWDTAEHKEHNHAWTARFCCTKIIRGWTISFEPNMFKLKIDRLIGILSFFNIITAFVDAHISILDFLNACKIEQKFPQQDSFLRRQLRMDVLTGVRLQGFFSHDGTRQPSVLLWHMMFDGASSPYTTVIRLCTVYLLWQNVFQY